MSLKEVKVPSLIYLEKELLQTHISRLYGFILAAVGLASTLHHAFLYDATHPLNFYLAFFVTIYLLAVTMLTWLLVWLHQKKKEDEARNDSSANTINNFGEGFNLYLKGGVVLFTVICITYNILRIVHLFQTNFMQCGGPGYFLFCLSQASFLALTAALFTLHDRVVIQKPTLFIRLIFTHLLVCCLCTWFHAGIGEIREGLENEMKKKGPNNRTMICEVKKELSHQSTTYSLPILTELSILEAPMLYDFVERTGFQYLQQHIVETPMIYPKLHKSTRGLLIGVAVIFISVILIAVVYLLEFNPMAMLAVYYTESIAYNILALVVSVLTYMKLRPLQMHPAESTAVDRHILWLSFFGAVVFGFLAITYSSYSLAILKLPHMTFFRVVDFLSSLLPLLTLCVQSLVIINAMHRVATNHSDVETKPGRSYITLLLCVNLSMWISRTFGVKRTALMKLTKEVTSTPDYEAIYLLEQVAMPFVLLFRFHSTVCLSMAWSYIYEIIDFPANAEA